MSDLEYLPSGIVVIPPELLEKASPEEKEAYFQYIVEKVIEADDWELWVKTFFPSVAGKPFSNAHREFWQWVWGVERDDRPTPWVSVWPRGFAKSTSTELAVTALAARGKRRYGLYVCHEKGTPILDPDTGKWMLVEEHPTAWERPDDGFEVWVGGLTNSEVVTPEHRYWAKKDGVIGWVEARDLDESTWIGLPLNEQTQDLLNVGNRIIEDEVAWSRVRLIKPVQDRTFIPITTSTSTYTTAFGLSHNCETQEQADDHVANVAALLTNPTLELAYPNLGEKLLDKHGNSKGWRRNRIRTGHGFTLDAMGLDSAARGVKLEDQRPDFICHEKGTWVYHEDWSGWVEDHPGNLGERDEVGVTIWIGDFCETVTYEHLYWARISMDKPGGWISAFALRPGYLIGTPIERAQDLEAGWMGPSDNPTIEDDWFWSKIDDIQVSPETTFIPINVGGDHTYLTRFGLSHNCLDDIDGELDTEDRTAKKIKTITRKIIPAGSQDCAVLMVQNLVHENSVFAQLVDGRADFLRDRNVSGPIPAIWNMDYEERDGKFVITGGEPSWPEGFPIASCQLLMNDIGLSAFLAECQHETKPPEGDVFSHINFARCSWDDVPKLKKTVVWVDPAVTSTDSSDSMGIHCDGLGTDGKIYRLWSWENRANPYAAIRLAVTKAIELNADVVGIEVNQGRDLWRGVYDQVCEDIRKEGEDYYRRLPRYKESIATKDLGSKIARAQRMLVDYERGVFVHVEGTHTTLEMALRRFPKVKPYDLVDSSFWAWNEIAGGMHRKKSRVSSARGRRTTSSI